MTVISLAHSNIIRSRSLLHKETSSKIRTKKLLVLFLIFSLMVVGLVYILQVNSMSSKGYEIRGIKKQINELENQNKALQITISDLKSINVLQLKSESFGMTKVQDIDYLALPQINVTAAR